MTCKESINKQKPLHNKKLTRTEFLQEEEVTLRKTRCVPNMEETYNLDSLFTDVYHSEEHKMTPPPWTGRMRYTI